MSLQAAISFNHQSVRKLAYVAREDAQLMEARRFSARPYNQFDPEHSLWWLIPSTDWPAHRYGKAILLPGTPTRDQILAGLHVEKGFGPQVGSIYPGLARRNRVLTDEWTWHQAQDDMIGGGLAQAAQAVAEAAIRTPLVQVSTYYPSDPDDFDPNVRFESDPSDETARPGVAGTMRFEVTQHGLSLTRTKWVDETTRPIAEAEDLGALAKACTTPKLDWLWVDIFIGVPISLAGDEPTPGAWRDADLWAKLLRPWLPWIR